MRPYKACEPQDTIHRIRTILKGLGIFVTEDHIQNGALCRSCRVKISNDRLDSFDLGTNGKGMDMVYSLASAYAEFMERLQNRILWVATKYHCKDNPNASKSPQLTTQVKSFDFRYFPDETVKKLTLKELIELCARYTPRAIRCIITPLMAESEISTMYFADFYNCTSAKKENVPYHLVRMAASTTGMCAGNTPAEAILQGLNEIFERYVLQELYVKHLTPPTIPNEVFENTEAFRRLKVLQKQYGWDFEIKDCSLGEGFPVIGLIIFDRKRNRYMFRLGADLSAEIALQRCFTEMFQGASKVDSFFKRILIDKDYDVPAEHDKNVVNSMGRYPRELFSESSSWEFKGFEHNRGETDMEDLRHLNHWLAEKGYELLVRDNSFTGFPVFHVYVPNLSDIDSSLLDLLSALRTENSNTESLKPEYNIKDLDPSRTRDLIGKYSGVSAQTIRMFPYNDSPLGSVNRNLLLAMLSYKIGEFREAYQYMDQFLRQMESENRYPSQYYYIVRDIFLTKSENLSESEVLSSLSKLYTQENAFQALKDLKDPQHILDKFPMTTCFECDKCSLKPSCCFDEILKLESRIQETMKKNIIDQSSLRNLFEH